MKIFLEGSLCRGSDEVLIEEVLRVSHCFVPLSGALRDYNITLG